MDQLPRSHGPTYRKEKVWKKFVQHAKKNLQ